MIIKIREAIESDTEQLRKLFLITRIQTFTSQPPEKFQLDDYAESVAGEEVWVADRHGIITGFVSMWVQDNFIHNLFVHPDWQGVGIGSQLLKKAEAQLVSPMELKVKTENLKACKFYQKHGWQEALVNESVLEPYFTYRK